MNSLLKLRKLWYRLHSYKSCLTNLSNEIKTASKSIGATLYDQRKKHFDGNGIPACRIDYISKNKIRWTLNENFGIWKMIKGDENAKEVQPIGFSVPTDIIMTRVE